MQKELTSWIWGYTNSVEPKGDDEKAKKPFRNAKITIEEVAGRPGCYNAKADLQPWFQLEEVTAELSMVADVPVKES
jgi:type VI secretion system protein ImpC